MTLDKPATAQPDTPLTSLASALGLAAAGGLLASSLLSAIRRRKACSGPLVVGMLASSAAILAWKKRQEEAEAARQLLDRFQDARDARWLRKNPIDYA